jgi:hypothetical protein
MKRILVLVTGLCSFAVAYRKRCGEMPSERLTRRPGQKS